MLLIRVDCTSATNHCVMTYSYVQDFIMATDNIVSLNETNNQTTESHSQLHFINATGVLTLHKSL